MDIQNIIHNSGIENPIAALYFGKNDGLLLAYDGNYFANKHNDPNKHAYQISQILKKNWASIIDDQGFGLIKYNSFDVYIYYTESTENILAVYK